MHLWKRITKIPIPKQPILTCWGTWIECGVILSENRNQIFSFLKSLDKKYENEVCKFFDNQILLNDLNNVKFYISLPKKIKLLEKNGTTIENQLNLFQSIYKNLQNNEDGKEFQRILDKNIDLKYFLSCLEEKNLEVLGYYKWLPISTAEVERSFSKYNQIFTNQRMNLKPETLYKMFLLLNK